jgi:tetratricopeptide (TPR) repeat protein
MRRSSINTFLFPGVYAVVLIAVLCSVSFHTDARQYTLADTALVLKNEKKAFKIVQTDTKGSLALAEEDMAISQALDYKRGIAGAYEDKGYAYFQMGDIKNALKYYQDALDYSSEYNIRVTKASTLSRLGNLYTVIGALDKAFDYYEQELKMRLAMKDSLYIADCYDNFAVILDRKKMRDESISYNLKAAEIYHNCKDSFSEAKSLSAIAEFYTDNRQFPKAFKYLTKALKAMGNGFVYNHLGSYYDDLGKNDSALYNYTMAFKIFARDSDRQDMARAISNVGTIEYKMGNFDAAEKHIRQGLEINIMLGDLQETATSEGNLAEVCANRKDYKEAYLHAQTSAKLNDSFSKLEMVDKLAELNTRFEVKEIEDKNKALQNRNDLQSLKLQRKNIFIYGALSALVLLAVIGALLFRQNKIRANQQKAELEQKQLRAQMNPHFIFNCLNSIQHFIVANDVKNANKYLSGFALLMRQTLENSKEGAVTLRKEIEYLENYLVLERMRFEDKFTSEIVWAENVNIDVVEIPSMIIQPFIENAIRHGLCYLDGKDGRLKISFYINGNYLYCEVDDNGIGREQSQKIKMASEIVYESQGMELTRQRLALVSKSVGSEYKIEIIDKRNAQERSEGTTIIIKFPLDS